MLLAHTITREQLQLKVSMQMKLLFSLLDPLSSKNNGKNSLSTYHPPKITHYASTCLQLSSGVSGRTRTGAEGRNTTGKFREEDGCMIGFGLDLHLPQGLPFSPVALIVTEVIGRTTCQWDPCLLLWRGEVVVVLRSTSNRRHCFRGLARGRGKGIRG